MSLVLPIYANLLQFIDILKFKSICPQFYIIKYLEYDAICAIVQDWINPANMIAFYAIHSKLTNIIRIYFKHCSDNGCKSEERAKSIRAVHSAIPQYHDYANCMSFSTCISVVRIFNNKGYIYLRPSPRILRSDGFSIDLKKLFDNINIKRIKKNNWEIRRYFAIFVAALVHYLNKHKIRTNKAGKVFFNRRLNRHMASYL